MNCKNCEAILEGEKKFCANCGAKVINYRLNFKTVTSEFFASFISWDNKFFKTFLHMLTKPQEVVGSYISGVRKRYMQPFSFMLIALTLYGILMFFAKNSMLEYMEQIGSLSKNSNQGINEKANKLMQEYQAKSGEFSMKYFNLITFMMIPVFSLINLIIFRKKQNFIEHNISVLYSYASYQFVFIIIAVVALLFKVPFIYLIPCTFLYMFIYHMYFFKKLFDLTLWQIIYKSILFFLMILFIWMIISIISMIIFFVLNRDAL